VHCSRLLKRRATTKSWKLAPSLRVAARIRPYFILALDGGPATAFGLGFVSAPWTKTCPWGPRSGRIFARNAVRLSGVNRRWSSWTGLHSSDVATCRGMKTCRSKP